MKHRVPALSEAIIFISSPQRHFKQNQIIWVREMHLRKSSAKFLPVFYAQGVNHAAACSLNPDRDNLDHYKSIHSASLDLYELNIPMAEIFFSLSCDLNLWFSALLFGLSVSGHACYFSFSWFILGMFDQSLPIWCWWGFLVGMSGLPSLLCYGFFGVGFLPFCFSSILLTCR